MSEFVVDGIKYQVIDSKTRTLRVGNDSLVNSNAVVSQKLNKRLHFIETYPINGVIYHLEEISRYAFRLCTIIDTVFVPDSVLYLRTRAFDCSSLRKIIFSPNSRVITFETGSLYGTRMKSISIPSTLSSCVEHCIAGSILLRNAFYCGDFVFQSLSFVDNKVPLTLHLSSSNSLGSLGSINIVKSSSCTLPSEILYCTKKVGCPKTKNNLLLTLLILSIV